MEKRLEMFLERDPEVEPVILSEKSMLCVTNSFIKFGYNANRMIFGI
jgi:hypothetical protein